MPTFVLTPAWQKVADAGQTVVVMNRSSAAAFIMTSVNGAPAADDGLVLDDRFPSEQFSLTADLYARTPNGPATLAVMSGIGASGGAASAAAASSTSQSTSGAFTTDLSGGSAFALSM